jgi:hypothetical protein
VHYPNSPNNQTEHYEREEQTKIIIILNSAETIIAEDINSFQTEINRNPYAINKSMPICIPLFHEYLCGNLPIEINSLFNQIIPKQQLQENSNSSNNYKQ